MGSKDSNYERLGGGIFTRSVVNVARTGGQACLAVPHAIRLGKNNTACSPKEGQKSDKGTCSLVAKRAWEIWWGEGCPSGRELSHWLQAERELSAGHFNSNV